MDGRVGPPRRRATDRLNGSFVTDIPEPNDVDVVLLTRRGFPKDRAAGDELYAGLPFLDIEFAGPRRFNTLVLKFFATDRFDAPKGMIEVIE